MTSYLLKVLATLICASFTIFVYYFIANGHLISFPWALVYVGVILFLYLIYKFWVKTLARKPETLTLNPSAIFSVFLLHLLILCCFFFITQEWIWTDWFILFFKVILFSLLPILIFLWSYVFWDTLLLTMKHHDKKSEIFKFLSGIWLWFFLFMFFLTIMGLIWLYNIYVVTSILLMFFVIGYKSLIKMSSFFFTHRLEFNNEWSSIEWNYLFVTEFLFFILTLLISTNLINVVRPFPIWWDDLWVYMNFASLMAQAESLLSLGSMYSWQVFTGIWYMTSSATQAFFLNSIGWMMSILAIYLVTKDLLKWKEKTFLNIPLLLATFFAAMPMIVFQLAKDMKLDTWLLFVSVIALYLCYKSILHFFEEKKITKHEYLYLWLLGVMLGFTFSIKVTSLILISGIFWVYAFSFLWTMWFLWYIAIYISIFTKFWLWAYMNISYPTDDSSLIFHVSALSLMIWVWSIWYAIKKHGLSMLKNLFIALMIWVAWILFAISPWLVKNISEAGQNNISVWSLLWGKSVRYTPDYSKIYTDEELKNIQSSNSWISATGTTTNEDWWRYFWYEEGINNYLKLPINLTMQVNQGGEFTDITFIYLALIPIIFLFLPFRRKEYAYVVAWVSFCMFLMFYIPAIRSVWTDIFSTITLPFWYLIILLLFLTWLLLSYFINTQKPLMRLFQINLVFTLWYTFLWAISAYGVVWYGIVMYVGFLMMIGTSLYYVSYYKWESSSKKNQLKLLWSMSIFSIFLFYFLMSSVPNALNNIKNSSYAVYKNDTLTAYEILYHYKPWYIDAIYAMNIDTTKVHILLNKSIVSNSWKEIFSNMQNKNFINIVYTFRQVLGSQDQNITALVKKEVRWDLNRLYENVTQPNSDYRNEKYIYRIGTFLKYYISENNKRLLEDSLLFQFNDYIYNENPEKTRENIKELDLWYILVDLNAATIDKDARRNLTARYEKLLSFFTTDGIDLVASDSVCLKLWLQKYADSPKTEADLKTYMIYAWVNYESYDVTWKRTIRTEKQALCYAEIINIINSTNNLTDSPYSFLQPIKNYLVTPAGKELMKDQKKLMQFFVWNVPTGRFAVFKTY